MIVSIHQPDYLPYIGYFYKIFQSDAFVYLDDAQYSTDNIHNWNRIKTPQGELKLKIPVENKLGMGINEVRTRDELKWKEKHIKTIEMNYGKAPFKALFESVKELILCDYKSLADMNIAINSYVCQQFSFKTKMYKASDSDIKTFREERVLDICEAYGAKTYISGNGARAYQNEENFTNRGIELRYTDYTPVKYNQLWKEFIPNMSILDYILNNGYEWEPIIEGIKDGNR